MYQRAGTSSGGGGGSAPELVWVNPSQYSVEFPQTTIDESNSNWISGKVFSDYDGFIIATLDVYYNQASRKVGLSYIAMDLSECSDVEARYSAVLRTTSADTAFRSVTVSSNSLTIGACSSGNLYIIPWYIWGVKGALSNS